MDSILAYASSGINQAAENEKLTPKQMELKNTCNEFEAVLTSLIMKEGMQSAQNMAENDMDNGSKTFMQMANEQMAYYTGKAGMLGFGDILYENVKHRIQE
jgi:Rod binding domain-containing protein